MNSRGKAAIRERIIDAAIAEFAEKGFNDARIDSIASSLGITPCRIYYYIGKKETLHGIVYKSLFEGISDTYLGPLFRHLDESAYRPDEKVMLLLYSVSLMKSDEAFRRLRHLVIRDETAGKKLIHENAKKHLLKYFYMAENIIKEGVACGQFEVHDTAMFVLNAVSFMRTISMNSPAVKCCGQEQDLQGDDEFQVLLEFVFKSLAPAGKPPVIPQPDGKEKKICATLNGT